MVFSTPLFIFGFLPAVLAVYFLVPVRMRNHVALAFSFLFYAWGARHLREDGILCVHLSNIHFDLRPVVQGLAEHLDMHAVSVEGLSDDEQGTQRCLWMLVSRRPIDETIIAATDARLSLDDDPILWTDHWSNLLSVLR